MFDQIYLSPQGKRCAIIGYKHDIYELPHELQNNLRKLGNIRKVSKLHRIIAWYLIFLPKSNFLNTSKKLFKNRN